ncbi:MAG TPA: hypothetical protein VFZ61_29775 [Polyangiales bacterium]
MKHSILHVALVGALAIGAGGAARAQVGAHGKITTRSDVKMSIEGSTGTSSQKLDALARSMSTPLAEVKRCYGELVKEHPEVVGQLTVQLSLLEGKPPKIEAPGATKELKPMQKCVDKAFAKLDVSEVPKPAHANVLLELTNSAAAAVNDVKQQGVEASRVEVEEKDGAFVSHGASLQGEISFDVSAKGPSGREAVALVHNGVRDALPGLFDCRRRASKKGSPEGDLVFTYKLSPTAKPSIEHKSTTVAAERAPFCTTSALKEMSKKGGRGPVTLTIHFHP